MKQTPSTVTQTKSELPLGADGGLGPHFPRPRASATGPASAFLARHGLPHLRTLTRAVPSARNARGRSAGFFSPFRFLSPETSPEDPQLVTLTPSRSITHTSLPAHLRHCLITYSSFLSPPPQQWACSPEHRSNLLRTRLTSNPSTLYVHRECFLNESSLKDKEKSSKDVKLGREDAMSDSFWKMSSTSS